MDSSNIKSALYKCISTDLTFTTAVNQINLFSVNTNSPFSICSYISFKTGDVSNYLELSFNNSIDSKNVPMYSVKSAMLNNSIDIKYKEENSIRTYYIVSETGITFLTIKKDLMFGDYEELYTQPSSDTELKLIATIVNQDVSNGGYVTLDNKNYINTLEPILESIDESSIGTLSSRFNNIFGNTINIGSIINKDNKSSIGTSENYFPSAYIENIYCAEFITSSIRNTSNIDTDTIATTSIKTLNSDTGNQNTIDYKVFDEATANKYLYDESSFDIVGSNLKITNIQPLKTDYDDTELDISNPFGSNGNDYIVNSNMFNNIIGDPTNLEKSFNFYGHAVESIYMIVDSISPTIKSDLQGHSIGTSKLADSYHIFSKDLSSLSVTTDLLLPGTASTTVIGTESLSNSFNIYGNTIKSNSTYSKAAYIDSLSPYTSGSTIMNIKGNINLGANGIICTSDERLKNIYSELSNSEWIKNVIKNTHIIDYSFKSDANNDIHLGVRAQDLEKNLPERYKETFVKTNDVTSNGGLKDQKSINKEDLVFILWAEVQRLQKEIEELKNK